MSASIGLALPAILKYVTVSRQKRATIKDIGDMSMSPFCGQTKHDKFDIDPSLVCLPVLFTFAVFTLVFCSGMGIDIFAEFN